MFYVSLLYDPVFTFNKFVFIRIEVVNYILCLVGKGSNDNSQNQAGMVNIFTHISTYNIWKGALGYRSLCDHHTRVQSGFQILLSCTKSFGEYC